MCVRYYDFFILVAPFIIVLDKITILDLFFLELKSLMGIIFNANNCTTCLCLLSVSLVALWLDLKLTYYLAV